MSVSLPNTATQDRYTAAATLRCAGAVKVNLQVFNAAVVAQFAQADARGKEPAWADAAEEDVYPNGGSFERACDGVRVRSKVAGVPAQVSIVAVTESENADGG